MSDEIKPCPFCGSKDIYMHGGSTHRWVVMQCINCDATCGETRRNTTVELTLKDAINEWNTRTSLPPVTVPSVKEICEWLEEDAGHDPTMFEIAESVHAMLTERNAESRERTDVFDRLKKLKMSLSPEANGEWSVIDATNDKAWFGKTPSEAISNAESREGGQP